MADLKAVKMTSEAARRLRAARGNGRIHSAYARTINILIGETPTAPWISLHGGTSIPSPFGIACHGWPEAAPSPGSAVTFGAAIRFETSSLHTDKAMITENRLPGPLPAPDPQILALALEQQANGLLPVAAAVLGAGRAPADALGRKALPLLTRLFETAKTLDDPVAAQEALEPLLGLGPGLTPSGDDCIVGWLAGAFTARPEGRPFVASLRAGLLASASRTNELSRACLEAAFDGAVSEPVYRFATTRTVEALTELVSTGETSGGDLLAGYLIARTALVPPKAPDKPSRGFFGFRR
ncbi:MAG: DUF2877 domain-containing protein [Candidatus Rokubacteria bacterium]|nr:DUF2877 domain-containing protein [Candidatus Rokubacteria bacterium]